MTINKTYALKELNEFKNDILGKINEARFLILTVDFDNIRTGKYMSNKTTDKSYAIKEIDYVINRIENWEVGESCHYSVTFCYNNEVIFSLDTSSIDELEEF